MEIAKKKRQLNDIILVVLFFGWLIGYCDKSAINVAVIPIAKEFALNSTQEGLIMSSFFVSYALMNLFGGMLADRIGSGIVITTIMFFWSIFTGLTGFAWSFPALLVIRFLFGAAEGGFPSGSSVTIAELFPVEKRGRAKSFLVSASNLGIALGTIIISGFVVTIGWRVAFWIYSVIGILIAIIFVVLFRKLKVQQTAEKKVQVSAAAQANKAPKEKVKLTVFLRQPFVWKLVIMQFAFGTFFWGLNSWMPTYWVNVMHLKIVAMGAVTSVASIIAFFFMNMTGFILDKIFAGKEKRLLCVLYPLAAFFIFLMYGVRNIQLAFVYYVIAIVAASMCSPVVFTIGVKYFPKEHVGAGSGLIDFGQQCAGILAPTVFGAMISAFHGSYIAVFAFVIVLLMIAFLVALTVNTKEAALKVAKNDG